jgi:hypothetical protein
VTRSVAFLEKSAWLARSSVIQNWDIAARKRQFGTDYMTLLQQGASEAQLAECVETAQLELDALTAQALQYQERAHCVDRFTQARLVRKPKASSTASATDPDPDPTEHWNNPAPPPPPTDDDDKLMKFKSINGINVSSGGGPSHHQMGQSKTATTTPCPAPSAPMQVGLHPDVQHAFATNNTDDIYEEEVDNDQARSAKKASSSSSIPYATATIVSPPPRATLPVPSSASTSTTPRPQQQQHQHQYQPSAPPAEFDDFSHK